MKKLSTTIIALAILLASCVDETENVNTDAPTNNIEQVEESSPAEVQEELMAEGTTVEGASRLDNLSNETAISDCYIVDAFVDMDTRYITVDFVTYTLDEDSQHTDYEVYDLVNDNPKLRTFVVHEQYMDCGRYKEVSIDDLIEKSKKDEKTVFSLETIEGIVTELYIDICSG